MSKTNKIHAFIYTALGLLLVFFAIMWGRSHQRNRELNTAVNNGYDRAFFELTDYVNNIDALLSKAQLAASPAQMASISNEIFMQAAEAKSCFGQLPQQNINLENTARFLSQVGDYTYVLSQNMINGTEITNEEYDTLNQLNQYASSLGKSLGDIEARIYSGEISFMSAYNDLLPAALAADPGILTDLENVEQSFDGYPSLIYDGPFSEHIENMESYMLKAAPEISRDEARAKAMEFLGERSLELEFDGETNNTAIETYNFTASPDGHLLTISITKRGGYVLYFLENRTVTEYNYDITAASEAAMQFLKSRQIDGMVENYYETKDNIATINMAYSQDGVKCYSDLIKLRVALDTGEVIGLESKGYLMNHRQRPVAASLTPEQARGMVSTHLDVTEVSLAIIPKDSLKEVLCYEFKGSYLGRNFIVYVNAINGREEDILLLIESETGVLTI